MQFFIENVRTRRTDEFGFRFGPVGMGQKSHRDMIELETQRGRESGGDEFESESCIFVCLSACSLILLVLTAGSLLVVIFAIDGRICLPPTAVVGSVRI